MKILLLKGLLAILATAAPCYYLLGQNNNPPYTEKMQMHKEVPGDPYLPNPNKEFGRSPSYRMKSTGVYTTQVNVDANGQNILGDAANEPSIAVDAGHANRMVIGWRQFDNVMSSFRQAGYGFSIDSGQTWTFPGVIEPGVFRSDPVLESDSAGNIFYNSLTSNGGSYTCKVFKTEDGGAAWNAGTEAHGGDKQWMAIDRTAGIGSGNIYSFWTSYYSSCYPGFFTRSTDAGISYENCVEVPDNPYWGTMTVGNDGELFIVGAGEFNGLTVQRSEDAQDPMAAVYWDNSAFVDMDGYITGQAAINPVGLIGQAYIDVDRSNGPGRGNIYILASMGRMSTSDPADVMFSKSTDGGFTWSDPIRINTDPSLTNIQWFGTMSVAPNGRIDVIWLDTRDAPSGTDYSALYYSFSTNQGETWSENEKISDSFDPHLGYPQQEKIGDYYDMESDETGANLAWANTFNGEQDVYYSRIIPLITGIEDEQRAEVIALSVYPNPFSTQTTLSYTLGQSSDVTIEIANIYGTVVQTVVNKSQPAGRSEFVLHATDLPAGFYICRLIAGKTSQVIGMVKVK